MNKRRRRVLMVAANSIFPRLTAVTTAPNQTVTIAEWNCTAATLIDWGDGQTTTHPANQNGVAVAHQYAAAGTYTIRLIVNPAAVREMDFRDTALRPNTAFFQHCTGITSFKVTTNVIITFDSSHLVRLEALNILYIHAPSVESQIIFDTQHLVNSPLTTLRLYSPPAGSNIIFNSEDLISKALTSLYCASFPTASVINFNSAHFVGMPLTEYLFYTMPAGTNFTLSAEDFAGFPAVVSVYFQSNYLTQAKVDTILEGLYTGLATRTAANGSINLAGNNATPSGVLQAMCPPTTGKEYAYELSHDTCGINPTKVWLTVSITA